MASLVQAALKNRAEIGTIIQQYEWAIEKLYKPKGYINEDKMWFIVLLQLGGVYVAEFAYKSLVLLSLTIIWHNTILPLLIISHSNLTLTDIETNIISSYFAFNTKQSLSFTIIHQVLRLNKIIIKKQIWWDDSTNKFQGMCKEYNHKIFLNFVSERELDLLCEALEKNNVYLAAKV